MKHKFQRFEGASALLAAACIYATFGLLIREIAKMMNDTTQTFVRFALAAVIITVVNLVMRKRLCIPLGALVRAALLGIIFAGVVLLFTISVTTTKIANSVFLLYAGSIITSFLVGTLAFKETVTVQKVIAILIAILGMAAYSGALLALSTGAIAGIGSGLLDGAANSLRKTLKSVDRNTVVMYQYGLGAAFALAITLGTTGIGFQAISIGPVIATLAFAISMLALSNLLLYGFQHFDVNVGTVILATELFFATILAYLFFKETPAGHELLGGALIFVASLVASLDLTQIARRFASSAKSADAD